ncbi:MAG: hypothetical protein K1X95_07535 [Acidimicrobiia bacterium]|nr:hypothetical protein [Acidimicrobiia bacterium]
MPYHLEKGPYLSVIESFADADEATLYDALVSLRNPASRLEETGGQAGPLSSPNVASPAFTNAALKAHVREHWLGHTEADVAGGWEQPAYGTVSQTGEWHQWYGDADAILRETFIRAAEVALGLAHGATLADPRTAARRWPVEFFWKCPQPWLEGWVTWRRHGGGRRDGQVTVVIATPGNGAPVNSSPVPAQPSKPNTPFKIDPKSATGEHGMWVVTHLHNEPAAVQPLRASGRGRWQEPVFGATCESTGPVVVVAPSEIYGGVLPGGRPV